MRPFLDGLPGFASYDQPVLDAELSGINRGLDIVCGDAAFASCANHDQLHTGQRRCLCLIPYVSRLGDNVGVIIFSQTSAMHKSKLAGFIIDCQTDDLTSAASFWSQALGLAVRPASAEESEQYVPLNDAQGPLYVEVQAVKHESRVHLDIETDDVEAEVPRLEGLGATRVAQIRDWWVMAAPTGQRFCIVPSEPDSENFSSAANEWP